MNRYQQMFDKLSKNKEGALVPFLTIGDPNGNIFMNIVDTIIEAGADALELGIPFSDPLADGPIIQNSMKRSLLSGITLKLAFNLVEKIRLKHPKIPIGLLTYANLIFQYGINAFYSYCMHIGIDSILIADLPLEESSTFYKISKRKNIKMVFICPPNATKHLLQKISIYSKGYIYLLSRPGVTGINPGHDICLTEIIQILKNKKNTPPILQGFGISKPNQVRKILTTGVAGIIIGSAVIKIIEQNIDSPIKILTNIKKYIINIKLATHLN
ncbi:tryptophan synthase subunit alpha [Blochmannia endosymbiont of Camponotus (Colobopsis) obliquus]|uniref:tryptophan synthase subunit alpha n=1 Tax=Blochmannia endosymbiont of Camponotus (Colobopsis) obliquus TaxID=1505597 RepID=UPI00061A79E3|nr:tryptophan synthase subunit alpha [Blochmannia endosymbiont of Camponotus (Colobopsis) obliquus]AKC60584.1 tryptophan synthase, alpha subunit [Blochmannia endosymbiont of Camponotus (Colobopsis) obliquus]